MYERRLTGLPVHMRIEETFLIGVALILLYCLTGFVGVPEAGAVTIYSYIDDQGNPVYTDAPETIPQQYRAKVQTHEREDRPARVPSAWQSLRQTLQDQLKHLGFSLPSFHLNWDGMNQAQSRILTYAGAAAVALLLMMYMSQSQLLRMLAFCLLIVVGIGAPVLMYVTEGGPMDIMKQKAKAAGQAREDHLQQIPR
jgi:Domain of unknown function (DUF4124)